MYCKKHKIINKCVLVSEIDKEVIKTYKGNFGSKHEMINIKNLDKYCSQCPPHDILFAGFPCQAFSNAGNKKGFLDETRGTLFFDVVQILKNKKPKYILLENVKHLINHDNGKTWKIITNTLVTLGYVIPKQPLLLSPHQFGIPQERWRVYLPGVLKTELKKQTEYLDFNFENFFKNLPTEEQIRKKYLEKKINSTYYLDESRKKDSYLLNVFKAWGEFLQNVKFPRGKTLPVIWLYEFTNPHFSDNDPPWKTEYLKSMNSLYENNKKFIDKWLVKYQPDNWKIREQKFEWQAGKDCKDLRKSIISFRQSGIRCKRFSKFSTLVAMAQTTLIFDWDKGQWRRITPREAARLQSFPDKYKTHKEITGSPNDFYSYKQFGNSINIYVVNKIIAELLERY